MVSRNALRAGIAALVLIGSLSCGGGNRSTPSAPTPTPAPTPAPMPAPSPASNLSVRILQAATLRDMDGNLFYVTSFELQETAGIGATVSAITLSVSGNGGMGSLAVPPGAALESAHVAPNATVRSVNITLGSESTQQATELTVRVTYTADDGRSGTTEQSVRVTAAGARVTLNGVVRDAQDDSPLQGVRVMIVDGPNANRGATTGAMGNYSIGNLEQGTFTITFTRMGYLGLRGPITVLQNSTLNVTMTRAPTTMGP